MVIEVLVNNSFAVFFPGNHHYFPFFTRRSLCYGLMPLNASQQ